MGRQYIKSLIVHPRIRKDGTVYRAVLVAEQQLGRFVRHNEDVHHINGNIEDDRPENLQVLSHREHSALHQRLRLGIPRGHYGNVNICHNGHELSPENTYYYINKNGRTQRQCRECDKLRKRRYYAMGKYHYQKDN